MDIGSVRAIIPLIIAFCIASLGIGLELAGMVLPGEIAGAVALPLGVASVILFSRGETEPRTPKT